MNPKPLLAAVLLAASCLPLRAQDKKYDDKDLKKAEQLAASVVERLAQLNRRIQG